MKTQFPLEIELGKIIDPMIEKRTIRINADEARELRACARALEQSENTWIRCAIRSAVRAQRRAK